MKVTVKVKWPTWITEEREVEVDVPDGQDVDDWLYDHEEELIEKTSGEPIAPSAIEMGYAGVERKT